MGGRPRGVRTRADCALPQFAPVGGGRLGGFDRHAGNLSEDTARGSPIFRTFDGRTRSPDRLSFVDGRASQASIRLMNQLSSLVQTSSLPMRSSTPCSRFGLSLTSMTTIEPFVSLMSTP